MKIWIHINGVQEGPYEVSSLPLEKMSSETPVWHDGLDDWVTASQSPHIGHIFYKPPQPDTPSPVAEPSQATPPPVEEVVHATPPPIEEAVQATPPPIEETVHATPPPVEEAVHATPPHIPVPPPLPHNSEDASEPCAVNAQLEQHAQPPQPQAAEVFEQPVQPQPAESYQPCQPEPLYESPYEPMPKCPNSYLVLSILMVVLCCNPIAIVPIFTGASVRSKYGNYDFDGAKKASETTEWWIMVSIVTSLMFAPLAVLLSL